MEQEKFDLKKVKVCRTSEGTIFETTALIILLTAWIVTIATQNLATTDKWFDLGVFSIATIVGLLCAYSPSHINLFSIQLRNIRQVELAIRMVRIVAVGFALMSFLIAVLGSDSPLTKVFCIGVLAVIGVIGFVFIYLIQKTK